MPQIASRWVLLLIVYLTNTASLFASFKAAALTLSPSQNVLLLSVHTVSMFVAQISDLGYSRPAYRNLARKPELAAQASSYYSVNLQHFLMMTLCLPIAYFFMPVSEEPLIIVLGILLIVALSLRSQWLAAADPRFFRVYAISEIIFSTLSIAAFVIIILLDYRPTLVVILSILVVARLGPVVLVSERLFRYLPSAFALQFDRDIFHESHASLGIKLVVLASHNSNGFFLVVLFTQSEIGMYLQADKLFYAGVGSFIFLSQDVIRLAVAGHFQRVPWPILGAGCFLITSVVTICFAITAPFFLKLLFSADYVGAVEPLRWMLLGFPFMATNILLENAYVYLRHHDGFALRSALVATFGNLLVVAAAYVMMRPDVAAFGVVASEGASLLFVICAFLLKTVQIGEHKAADVQESAVLSQSSSNTPALAVGGQHGEARLSGERSTT